MAGIEYNIYYIPEGLPNLKTHFPTINFDKVAEWNVYVTDSNGNVVATTRQNKIGCCCVDDKERIHFINSLGEIDSINFIRVIEETESKSDSWQKAQKFPLNRTKGGNYRKNIKSNESYEAETRCYGETEQYWIKELLDAPKAWIETNLPNGFQESIEKAFIPIQITDAKLPTRKNTQRYEYIVKIKFSMSNENQTLR